MKLPQTGSCQCGAIRYEITEEPQLVYTCHCTDCQRLTSSAFSMGVVVPERAFRLSGAEPRPLQRIAYSGRTNIRLVCPQCGTWICGMPRDGRHRVRAGTLDDTSWLRPTRHIWTRSKQAWVTLPENDEVFEAASGVMPGGGRAPAVAAVFFSPHLAKFLPAVALARLIRLPQATNNTEDLRRFFRIAQGAQQNRDSDRSAA